MKTLFLALTVASVALSQPTNQPCPYLCEQCRSDGFCRYCLDSQSQGRHCAPVKDPQNCQIYDINGNCEICQPGYALVTNKPFSESRDASGLQATKPCQPSTIQNCEVGLAKNNGNVGYERCLACKGGFPSPDYKKCVAFNGESQAKNCVWGTRSADGKSNACFRCALGTNLFNNGGICYYSPQGRYGCMSAFDQTCLLCNFYEGFYMDRKGHCKNRIARRGTADTVYEAGEKKKVGYGFIL